MRVVGSAFFFNGRVILPVIHHQTGIDVFPRAILAPLGEVVVNRIPARKLAGQIAPATAVFEYLQNAIYHVQQGPFAASAYHNQRLNTRPMCRL